MIFLKITTWFVLVYLCIIVVLLLNDVALLFIYRGNKEPDL